MRIYKEVNSITFSIFKPKNLFMQNELSFGVEFTRAKIESILKDPGVTRIIVSGKYSHNGKGAWNMNATVVGSPTNQNPAPQQADCIQPCPTT